MPVCRRLERYSDGDGGGGCRCKVREEKDRIGRKWDREAVLDGPGCQSPTYLLSGLRQSPQLCLRFGRKSASGPVGKPIQACVGWHNMSRQHDSDVCGRFRSALEMPLQVFLSFFLFAWSYSCFCRHNNIERYKLS